jgi:hypothetical protein
MKNSIKVGLTKKKTAESLEIEPRKKIFNSLKGCKYVLLKRESNLKKEQKENGILLIVWHNKSARTLFGVNHSYKVLA